VFLKLTHIAKHFQSRDGAGVVRAVDDVSIDIERGEFVTLLGPSGCGKTTTLRLIAGFEFPTQGDLILDGERINDLPPNRRDMAMVFQSYAVFPHLNVFENIAYGPRIKKFSEAEIRRKVSDVLVMTELQGLENRAPNQLSGGQQQRVALARALVMQPKVLLFDEPLSNLDAKLRVQMRSEIRRIQQSLGITSVYVTHDQDEAMVLSDKIVVMSKGRIQQVGNAVTIYRRPSNRFVADFIGRANFLPVEVVSSDENGWRFRLFDHVICAPAAALPFEAGQSALLMLRPESMVVTATQAVDDASQRNGTMDADEPPALQAEVKRTSYLGTLVEYDLDLDGHAVLAVRHDPGEADLYAPGTKVTIRFLGENLYLLPPDAANGA
jgi:iron(III) transport system ATP-binding protein